MSIYTPEVHPWVRKFEWANKQMWIAKFRPTNEKEEIEVVELFYRYFEMHHVKVNGVYWDAIEVNGAKWVLIDKDPNGFVRW